VELVFVGFKCQALRSGTLPTGIVVRALKPAICLHGPLLLGRSSLPLASRQTLKIPRGNFDQALWWSFFTPLLIRGDQMRLEDSLNLSIPSELKSLN
jgi:hypothetical protein